MGNRSAPAAERRRYQREVADLLAHIDEQSRKLNRLELRSGRQVALGIEGDLKQTRRELAELIRTRRPARPAATAAA